MFYKFFCIFNRKAKISKKLIFDKPEVPMTVSPLLWSFQEWYGYQNDWGTFKILTVSVFCAKIGLDSSKVQKTSKKSAIFITLGGYIFLGQMVSVGNYRGVVSSRDKIFYVGPSTHTWGYGKFVNARYARFTNSNAKLRLRLRLHLDFLPSLRSGKKPAIRPCAFIRPYIY